MGNELRKYWLKQPTAPHDAVTTQMQPEHEATPFARAIPGKTKASTILAKLRGRARARTRTHTYAHALWKTMLSSGSFRPRNNTQLPCRHDRSPSQLQTPITLQYSLRLGMGWAVNVLLCPRYHL